MKQVPVRVDFAGGWLDVPKLARADGIIVNCSIQPLVSKGLWPYEQESGIGGSAAWSALNGNNPIDSELSAGVGWQDPAIILETGLCAWKSGSHPQLICKFDPRPILSGKMALFYVGGHHITRSILEIDRDYDLICRAGEAAFKALISQSFNDLCVAISMSYAAQLKEGMEPLPQVDHAVCKYCGSGWGGYGLYCFSTQSDRDNFVLNTLTGQAVEPYFRHRWEE